MTTNPRRPQLHTLLAIASIVAPLLAVGSITFFQKLAHAGFWNAVRQDEAHLAGLMAASEVIQLLFALGIGLLIGTSLAIASIRPRKRILSLGLFALCLNGIPLVLLASIWVLGRVHAL
jgi:hypothetical protein